MPFLDPPDTIIAGLSLEGRNLLARNKCGDVAYRVRGWQLGRGGYVDDTSTSGLAFQTVTVSGLPAPGDTVEIGGIVVTAVASGADLLTQFDIGATVAATATNIATTLNGNLSLHPSFLATVVGPVVTITARAPGTLGNFVQVTVTGPLTLGGPTLAGGFGTQGANPVKVKPWVEGAVQATGYIQLIDNAFDAGDAIVLNGRTFTVNVHWTPGPTLGQSAQNLIAAIEDARDPLYWRLLQVQLDPSPDVGTAGIIVTSLVPGLIGNQLTVAKSEAVGLGTTINFLITPMAGGLSAALIDPAYPVPPTFGTFSLPDGRIEFPAPSADSFVMRVPEGAVGLDSYGELATWVEILASNFPPEVGRLVLYSWSHFPIKCKTDRDLLTLRVITTF
jgi:hypothetical protein